jgi:hypothetical protein
MDRFLVDYPSDEAAVFVRPDNNKISMDKGCRCANNLKSIIEISDDEG